MHFYTILVRDAALGVVYGVWCMRVAGVVGGATGKASGVTMPSLHLDK